MPIDPRTGINYELHGRGVPLLLAPPMIPAIVDASTKSGYLDRLTDRYRVLMTDYPGYGHRSRQVPATELNADRVCADMLSIANHAGFENFAWWGYSWGAVVGLQVASRSERVSALVCGGWPPLGADYSGILELSHASVAMQGAQPSAPGIVDPASWVTFYASLQDWPEADGIGRIACPRMTFVGARDIVAVGDTSVEIGPRVIARQAELERLGWEVRLIPGRDHGVYADAPLVVPPVRDFLDRATRNEPICGPPATN